MNAPLDLRLRSARSDDAYSLWLWANDPAMRVAAFNPEHISWDTHLDWLKSKLSSPDVKLSLASNEAGRLLGCIRFETKDDWESAKLSYTIASEARGVGYGRRIVEEALAQLRFEHPGTVAVAEVKSSNAPSISVFRRLGWSETDLPDNALRFVGDARSDQRPDRRSVVLATSRPWNAILAHDLRVDLNLNVTLLTAPSQLTAKSLANVNPRFLFFAHWSTRIPDEVWSRYECVVFHMTDLPFGRGGSPLQNLIAQGHAATALTAIRCVRDMDAGPVYLKRPISLDGTASEIFFRARDAMREMMKEIATGKIEPTPQVGDVVEFKRRKPEQSSLQRCSNLEEIFDAIRMLDAPGYPAAFLSGSRFVAEFSEPVRDGGEVHARARFRFTLHSTNEQE
jgi:methionyl-tRNA formyltransferase